MDIPNNKISERSLILELAQKLVVPPLTTPLIIPLIVIKKERWAQAVFTYRC